MIRWVAEAKMSASTGAMSRSGRHDPGNLGVGGVGHEQVDALGAEPRDPAEVGQPPVQRQLVHFEVAGVQDHARAGPDGDRERVRDRVVDRQELAVERPERLPRPGADLDGLRGDPVLDELAADQAEGQPGPDQRDVRPRPQQVRDGPDVVLVGAGYDHGLDEVVAALQAGEVGQDQVHPGLVGLGEQHAAVHDDTDGLSVRNCDFSIRERQLPRRHG